ncbi:MAG: DUF359 domain-containing protein [Candidatus Micrarchaeota archaeon]
MVRLSEELKGMLKKPLGKTGTLESLLPLVGGRKIIAVGDQVVFALLSKGIRPHVAVFDFKTMRARVDSGVRKRIEREYPSPMRVVNEPGTISEEIFLSAPMLIRKGGALFVEGEEDLVAFPFILSLTKKSVVLYGQPGEGCVFVEDKSEGRETVKKIAGKLGLASLSD